MPKLLTLSYFLALIALLSGCMSSQEMRLHYAVVNIDEPNPEIKFYRVTLHGASSNVKANMTTGYYDANTLRNLFGGVQNNSGAANTNAGATVGANTTIIPSAGQMVFQYNGSTRTWTQLPPTTLFTMIYGADSQALSDSIKSFQDNDQTGQAMGQLFARAAGGDAFDAAVSAEQQQQNVTANVEKLDSAIGNLAIAYTNTINQVNSAAPAGSVSLPPPDRVDLQLLSVVQQAIKLLGSNTILSTNNLGDSFTNALQVYQLLNQTVAK